MSVCGEPHPGAGDVEMRPWRLVDKALQQLRGGNGAAVAATGIFHVGEFRIDHLVVFRPQRHPPHPLTCLLADFDQAIGELVVVGEQPGIFLSERDDDRAGQGGEIDHEFRLEALVHVVQDIGEHGTAFGIGVDDLDGLPRHVVTMSPGRCARPSGMFSTMPIAP
jgi:hypothetical protein